MNPTQWLERSTPGFHRLSEEERRPSETSHWCGAVYSVNLLHAAAAALLVRRIIQPNVAPALALRGAEAPLGDGTLIVTINAAIGADCYAPRILVELLSP